MATHPRNGIPCGRGSPAIGASFGSIDVWGRLAGVLADQAIAAGAKGILFASRLSPGGINLVLYTELLGPSDEIAVYDPAGALPKNQMSWT